MTATLKQSQTDLPKLVELASHGEDVVITVDGKPKARLTRTSDAPVETSSDQPIDMAAWMKELDELRRKYDTGKHSVTVEQILEETRADRV